MPTVSAAHDFVVKGEPGLKGVGSRADPDDGLGSGNFLEMPQGFVIELPSFAENDQHVALGEIGNVFLLFDTGGDGAGMAICL